MLSVYEFGKNLIETGDLDPVYTLLQESGLDELQLRKWLLAYWCFYHVGTSSWITDGEDYWGRMRTAAGSKDYPRSSERRHFRGENARKSVTFLEERGLQRLFLPFTNREGLTVNQVTRYVQTWVGFGPWIAFKVADMLDRLALCSVRFDAGAMFLFDSPREGAELLAREEGGPEGKVAGLWAVELILAQLGDNLAPPRYERKINVQEVETILCKWKSYRNGHYELGEDIEAVREGLLRFSKCRISQNLLKAGKSKELWI